MSSEFKDLENSHWVGVRRVGGSDGDWEEVGNCGGGEIDNIYEGDPDSSWTGVRWSVFFVLFYIEDYQIHQDSLQNPCSKDNAIDPAQSRTVSFLARPTLKSPSPVPKTL